MSMTDFDKMHSVLTDIFELHIEALKAQGQQQFEFITQIITQFQNWNEHLSRKAEHENANHGVDIFLIAINRVVIEYCTDKKGVAAANTEELEQYRAEWIDTFERKINLVQSPERFTIQPDDQFSLRLLKYSKLSLYNLYLLPLLLANQFRKWRKRPLKKIDYWTHDVALKQIADFSYNFLFDRYLYGQRREFWKQISENYLFVKTVLDSINNLINRAEIDSEALHANNEEVIGKFIELQKRFDEPFERFRASFEVYGQKSVSGFLDRMNKAGTVELLNRQFRPARIKKLLDRQDRQHQSEQQNWQQTILDIFNEWRLRVHIDRLIFKTIRNTENTINTFSVSLETQLVSAYKHIVEHLGKQAGKTRIAMHQSKDYEQLHHNLKEELSKNLNEHILNDLQQRAVNMNIPGVFTESDAYINELLNDFPNEHYVSENRNFRIPHLVKSVKNIKSYKLIIDIPASEFNKKVQKQKLHLIREVERMATQAHDIEQMVRFNVFDLQSVNVGEQLTSDFLTDALNGLDRAINRSKDILADLQELKLDNMKTMRAAVEEFYKKIDKYSEIDYLLRTIKQLENQYRILQIKNFAKGWWRKTVGFVPALEGHAKNLKAWVEHVNEQLKNRLGIGVVQDKISLEVIHYLSETKKAINALPVIYQQLFALKPLGNPSFYYTREEQDKDLDSVWNSFESGHYASTILVGESGTGKTTLINFFCERNIKQRNCYRATLKQVICTRSDLLAYLSQLFGFDDPLEFSDLVKWLNKKKHIIILENIHLLFLRKSGGFDAILLLLELIQSTGKNNFWLVSIGKYAYQYLAYSQSIGDYFYKQIHLSTLEQSAIREIINKRHKPSGFLVRFEAPKSLTVKRKLRNLNPEQKQKLFEDEYFKVIYEFAQGNLKLALLFWLRSTQSIKDDYMHMKAPETDYTFLQTISSQKIIALHNFVLHDLLEQKSLAEIMSINNYKAQSILFSLMYDGILVQEDEYFRINPLLYRQIVEVLKSKNFIH